MQKILISLDLCNNSSLTLTITKQNGSIKHTLSKDKEIQPEHK